MPWGVAAAGALSIGGDIFGGIMGGNAASKAAKQQQEAAAQAEQLEQQMFQQTQQNIQPWMQGGQNALTALQGLYGIGQGGQGAGSPVLSMLGLKPGGGGMAGFDPSTFQGSPGYQWQKQQGMDAITNSAAARGGLGGNTLKALDQYGTGLANQDFYNYLNSLNTGWQGLTGGLYNLSGQGLQGADTLGRIGASVGNNVANNITSAGAAAAAGTIGQSNALTKGISGALNDLGGLASGLLGNNTGASSTGGGYVDSGNWNY